MLFFFFLWQKRKFFIDIKRKRKTNAKTEKSTWSPGKGSNLCICIAVLDITGDYRTPNGHLTFSLANSKIGK